MLSLVLLAASFVSAAFAQCDNSTTVTIEDTDANPWCESTCLSLSSTCTIHMPSTTCSAREDEYTCMTPNNGDGRPPCYWNETECITWAEHCAPLTNETECNSNEYCNFEIVSSTEQVCIRNPETTGYLSAHTGSLTTTCIDCASFNNDSTNCHKQVFCYYFSTTDSCKRVPEAPQACSADDDDDDMPLILGLSIGLGVPFLLVVVYFMTRKRGFTILDSATEGFLNG